MQLTIDVWMIFVMIGFGAFVVLVSVFVGAFLVYKTYNARPGEGFVGGIPKGQVFSIPDPLEDLDKPDDLESNVLKRASQFLSSFGGGKNNEG